VVVEDVTLSAGSYVMKISFDTAWNWQGKFNYVEITSGNASPTVDAGVDQTIALPTDTVSLDATVTDDGLPDPPDSVTTTWTKQSGAGTVTFGNASAVDTTAEFSAAGTYVLRLTGDDSELTAYDEVTITVHPENTAPSVNAGADQGITVTETLNLNGTVTDDGYPDPPASVTTTWSKDSGAGTVTFGDTSAVDTTAVFSAASTYVLRLTADDGAEQPYDTCTVTVSEVSATALPGTIQAEDYKTGGQNVGYYDTTSGNSGGEYRSDDVDIGVCGDTGGGYYVGWTTPTEWLAYDVTVSSTQNFDIVLRVASTSNDRQMRVLVDGVDVSGAVQFDSTGGEQTYTDMAVTAVEIESGSHVLKVAFETYTINLNYIDVSVSQSAPTVDAGTNETITWPTNSVNLDGTVSDDGNPDPPGALTTTWTKVSGPGTVTFADSSAVDTTATFSTYGVYVLRLTADDGALQTSDTVTITVNDTSRFSIPGTIQLEDYHDYYDTSAGNTGGSYRTDDVDIYVCNDTGGGYCIGYIDMGEWLSFNVNVSETGYYKLTYRACSQLDSRQAGFLVDGEDVTGTMIFGSTYSYPDPPVYTDVVKEGIPLTAGDHVITLEFGVMNHWGDYANYFKLEKSQDAPAVNAGLDQEITLPSNTVYLDATTSDDGLPNPPGTYTLRWFAVGGPDDGYVSFSNRFVEDPTVTFSYPGTYVLRLTADDSLAENHDDVTITVNDVTTRVNLPGRLEAEDYSGQGAGVSYHDTTSGNAGGVYRSDDVDIESCGDTGGGYDVAWIVADEWLAFDVDVPQTRCYDIVVRVSSTTSSRQMHVEVDGTDVTGAMTFDSTGGWTDVTAEGVCLTLGKHVVKVVMDTGDFKLNYVDILNETYEEYIVENGVANADIVISSNPFTTVTLAADELQAIVQQTTGATLPIVTTPTSADVHIYVGQSSYTEALGISTTGLQYDGFKIASGSNWLALIGADSEYEAIEPTGEDSASLALWDAITGSTYRVPMIENSRNYNWDMDLWQSDGCGSLQAVYEFLRGLGCRWYYPGSIGEVIPDLDDIGLTAGDRTVQPDYPLRNLFMYHHQFAHCTQEQVLWQLRLGLNMGQDSMGWTRGHGIGWVMGRDEMKAAHPEYFTLIGGVRDTEGWKGDGNPCLSSTGLVAENVNFIRKMFDHYDEPMVNIAPQDGFQMCQCSLCAGKDTMDRGMNGWHSDYVHAYCNQVTSEVYLTHANKKISIEAYATYHLPPLDFDAYGGNVVVIFPYWATWLIPDEDYQTYMETMDDWLDMISTNQVIIWDFYLHGMDYQDPGNPVYFPRILKRELRSYADEGTCLGKFIEVGWNYEPYGLTYTGLEANHLNIYVTGQLLWDAELDLPALLDEYYENFYGPAADEMKEFVEYCEANYEYPLTSSTIISGMRTRLNAAIAAAGTGIYADRVDLLDEYLKVVEE